jgi:sulfur carrier protein
MGSGTVSFRDAVFVFMRLIVNGEDFNTKNAETIQELLKELRIEPGRVAVEVNLSIIKKADYESYRLKDGDKVEIVNFVGGGCR